LRALPAALGLILVPSLAAARAPPVVSFEDPAGDDTGSGSYSYPTGGDFRAGDFDLRRFEVRVEGDVAVLEVTLEEPVREPASLHRTSDTPAQLDNRIYLQNIDIYVDRDPGRGHSACIPGRHVAIDGWDTAVVLTPQPAGVRAVVDRALGDAARDVIVPGPLEIRGATIAAHVPLRSLGGTPTAAWGWSVQISGADWERSFGALDFFRGTDEPDAFTLPVRAVAEDYAFGGGGTGRFHPRVVDVLLPAGMDQRRVLGAYDEKAGTYARIPFVRRGETGPRTSLTAPLALAPAAAIAEAPGLVVVEASREMLSATGPVGTVKPFQFGVVLDGAGGEIGHVVVVKVLEEGLVASVIDSKKPITAGARLRFDEAGPAPAEAP
jgi:carbohydrate-binding DOMON domain-containing protein